MSQKHSDSSEEQEGGPNVKKILTSRGNFVPDKELYRQFSSRLVAKRTSSSVAISHGISRGEVEEESVDEDELCFTPDPDIPDIFAFDRDELAKMASEDDIDILTDESRAGPVDEGLIRPDYAFGYSPIWADERDADEFTLLEPDHPQMMRFQTALRERHESKNNELVLKIKQIGNELKMKKADKEEIAVNLHYLQTDLDKAKIMLSRQDDEFQLTYEERMKEETGMEKVQGKYDNELHEMECLRQKLDNVKLELANVTLKTLYAEKEGDQLKSNITVTRRCVSKSNQVMLEVEEKQQEHDIWITKLDQKIEKMEEDTAQLENNLEAQHLERKEINSALMEAEVELEAVRMEKKNLIQRWYCSLAESQKVDDVYNTVSENYKIVKNRLKVQNGEYEKLRRLLAIEHEKNSLRELDLQKIIFKLKAIQNLLTSKEPVYRNLRERIEKLENIIKETNIIHDQTKDQAKKILAKIAKLSKIYDNHLMERNKVRMEIEQKAKDKEITDNISIKLAKQMLTVQNQTILLEKQMVTKENDVSKGFVRISKHLLVNSTIEKLLNKLLAKVEAKDRAVAASQVEVNRLDSLIKHKNAQMVVLQNRVDHLLILTGGRNVNPYELQLSNLNHQIELENVQINELRKIWLADQAELIHMMKERDAEEDKINMMKQEIMLMEAKKMRIEGQIDAVKSEISTLQRRQKYTQLEMIKIDALIFKEKTSSETKLNHQKFSVYYFNASLKDEQSRFIDMQVELDVLMNKKEEMVEELIELEKQVLLWEKKVHISKEMKATFGNMSWREEINSMKNEIWKMELRKGVLNKEIEKLNQKLEQLAVKTVDLLSVDEASVKAKQKANLNRQISDLQDKVKETTKELKRLDKELHRLVDDGLRLQDEIFKREVELLSMQNLMESMESDVKLMRTAKIRNLKEIVLSQNMLKDFELAITRTMAPWWTPSTIDGEKVNVIIECDKFLAIMKELQNHYPDSSNEFKFVIDSYKSKLLDMLKKCTSTDETN